jgi:hypothetical protein
MSTKFNEVLIHLNESLDGTTLHQLEQDMRQDKGVISVGHRPNQHHLMVVVYDSEVARGASLLQRFQERGLHAQLVGM